MKRRKKKMGWLKCIKKSIFIIMICLYPHSLNLASEIIDYTSEKVVEVQTVVKGAKVPKMAQKTPIENGINKMEIKVCSNSSVKTYMDYKKITNKSSKQWQFIHNSGQINIVNGYLMSGEYIGVALGSYFGEIGSRFIFTLEDGKEIKVIKVEEKADAHTINGCQQKWDNSVIEFVIDSDYFPKANNGYVYSGNFNNLEQFKGKIIKIEKII